jgi:hypothetical protein
MTDDERSAIERFCELSERRLQRLEEADSARARGECLGGDLRVAQIKEWVGEQLRSAPDVEGQEISIPTPVGKVRIKGYKARDAGRIVTALTVLIVAAGVVYLVVQAHQQRRETNALQAQVESMANGGTHQ